MADDRITVRLPASHIVALHALAQERIAAIACPSCGRRRPGVKGGRVNQRATFSALIREAIEAQYSLARDGTQIDGSLDKLAS